MTQVRYDLTSPYGLTTQTTQTLQYLDFWNAPYVQSSLNDTLYRLEQKYKHRPDLLSYDMYKTTGYWWVFAIRNPDIIQDPIYDFVPGIVIYLPIQQSLPRSVS